MEMCKIVWDVCDMPFLNRLCIRPVEAAALGSRLVIGATSIHLLASICLPSD